jgi:hypothetical protein
MLKSALSSQHCGPWLAILSQEINRLGSVWIRPVPSGHMSRAKGIVQIRLVAQTQGQQYLGYLLRFFLLASVAHGSRGTKVEHKTKLHHVVRRTQDFKSKILLIPTPQVSAVPNGSSNAHGCGFSLPIFCPASPLD